LLSALFWADEKWANGTAQKSFLPFLQCMTNEGFPSQSAVVRENATVFQAAGEQNKSQMLIFG